MYSKTIENYKKKIRLTSRQKEIIIGKLLGDGHLETQNNGRTYRLKIEHSFSQKEYVNWLFHELKNLTLTPPQTKWQRIDQKLYRKYWFNTISYEGLRFYAQQFYQGKRKKIPKLIHRWLTPLVLAIWFMDDGSLKSKFHQARIINTQGFTQKDIKVLMTTLKNKFNLETKLRRQSDGYQIMILAESAKRFAEIIRKFIHPSLSYKLKGLS